MENSHNENKNSITIKKISEDNVNEDSINEDSINEDSINEVSVNKDKVHDDTVIEDSMDEVIVDEVRTDKIVTDFANKKNKSTENNIEIWEDLINIKDLIIALIICIITTFGGYTLSPNESYKPLLFGLVGAILGFIISSFLIDPKREVIQEKKEL